MRTLIRQAGNELIRRRFATVAELIAGIYASLVRYLLERELIREGPFDAAPCRGAALADLDPERMTWFLREAKRARGFPLSESAAPTELLVHLNLLHADVPTHAAVLLFGRQPQRFLISSEIKCAHFHGTEVAKPIPSYQVYKGTVFQLVDQAVDFVLSKINLAVGTRATSTQAPVSYELPPNDDSRNVPQPAPAIPPHGERPSMAGGAEIGGKEMNRRDHIATAISIEPEDLELSPFPVAPKLGEGGNQRGGLGNSSRRSSAKAEAHQLFGEQLPKLLDELNEVLAA